MYYWLYDKVRNQRSERGISWALSLHLLGNIRLFFWIPAVRSVQHPPVALPTFWMSPRLPKGFKRDTSLERERPSYTDKHIQQGKRTDYSLNKVIHGHVKKVNHRQDHLLLPSPAIPRQASLSGCGAPFGVLSCL